MNSRYNLRSKKFIDDDDTVTVKRTKRKRIEVSDSSSDSEDNYDDMFMESDYDKTLWKEFTSKNKVKQLEPCFKKITDEIKNREITEVDIMESDLTFKDKVEMMEWYRVLQNTDVDTEMWLMLKIKLYNQIKRSRNITETDRETIKILESTSDSSTSTELQIVRSKLPDKTKSYIYSRYQEIKDTPSTDESYGKRMEWINYVLKIPTDTVDVSKIHSSPSNYLSSVYDNMEKNIFGQQLVKERILEISGTLWSNPECNKKSVVFVGPPGVGKTQFATCVAEGIGLPFYQISFGGAKDSSFLKGHGFTYVGAEPGELYKALAHMKSLNGVLYLDELDKIQQTENGREVESALLHILDPTQNSNFKDEYLGVGLDLSKLLVIISVNSVESINKILLDRLHLINFNGYTDKDKLQIGYRYMVPKMLKNTGLTDKDVVVTEDSVRRILSKSKKESGVRQLERNISTIFSRINVLKQLNKKDNPAKKIKLSYDILDFKTPFVLDNSAVDKLFYEFTTVESLPPVSMYI